MAIADSDILVYTTYGQKFESLGGKITAVGVVDSTRDTEKDEYRHNLFDWIRPDDIDNARSTYRCIAIKNNHADTNWTNVKAWIVSTAEVQSEVSIEILKETPSGSPLSVQQIASEYEQPSGTFASPTTKSVGQDIGTINFGEWAGLWIKRTPTIDAKSRSHEQVIIRIEGDDGDGVSTYCGKTLKLRWDTLTDEIAICLSKLNDIPRGRIDLRGAQDFYDDAEYLVNQLSSSNATDDQKQRVAMARTMYHVYQEYSVEVERAGGGLPPMVVSRVYELRRIANEMFNSISKTPKRMESHVVKGRSYRSRLIG